MLAKIISSQKRNAKAITFNQSKNHLLVGYKDGFMETYDLNTNQLVSSDQIHKGPVRCIISHPAIDMFASCSDDRKIKLHQPGKPPIVLEGHLDYIRSINFHGIFPWLISSSDDSTARIWNWQSRSCIATLSAHKNYVFDACFDPFNLLAYSVSLDTSIIVWDISQLPKQQSSNSYLKSLFSDNVSILTTREIHASSVNCLAFSPNGALFATGGDDNEIRVFRTHYMNGSSNDSVNENSIEEIHSLLGHSNNITSLCFVTDKELASSSEDGQVLLWRIDRSPTKKILYSEKNCRIWKVAYDPKSSLFALATSNGMRLCKNYDTIEKWAPAVHSEQWFRINKEGVFFQEGEESFMVIKNKSGKNAEEMQLGVLDPFGRGESVHVLVRAGSSFYWCEIFYADGRRRQRLVEEISSKEGSKSFEALKEKVQKFSEETKREGRVNEAPVCFLRNSRKTSLKNKKEVSLFQANKAAVLNEALGLKVQSGNLKRNPQTDKPIMGVEYISATLTRCPESLSSPGREKKPLGVTSVSILTDFSNYYLCINNQVLLYRAISSYEPSSIFVQNLGLEDQFLLVEYFDMTHIKLSILSFSRPEKDQQALQGEDLTIGIVSKNVFTEIESEINTSGQPALPPRMKLKKGLLTKDRDVLYLVFSNAIYCFRMAFEKEKICFMDNYSVNNNFLTKYFNAPIKSAICDEEVSVLLFCTEMELFSFIPVFRRYDKKGAFYLCEKMLSSIPNNSKLIRKAFPNTFYFASRTQMSPKRICCEHYLLIYFLGRGERKQVETLLGSMETLFGRRLINLLVEFGMGELALEYIYDEGIKEEVRERLGRKASE